jgi:hypothetical protein
MQRSCARKYGPVRETYLAFLPHFDVPSWVRWQRMITIEIELHHSGGTFEETKEPVRLDVHPRNAFCRLLSRCGD